MTQLDNSTILKLAMEQQAFDSNCKPEDFLRTENVFTESMANPNAHRYLKLPLVLDLTSFGNNVVVSGRADLLPEFMAVINSQAAASAYKWFESPFMYKLNEILAKADSRICFMADYFLPDVDKIFEAGKLFDSKIYSKEFPYELKILTYEDLRGLYTEDWGNALCAGRSELDVIGVGAYDKERLVGLAGASADAQKFWQIGIDVLPEYRCQGIAATLTNRLAREIFERGKIPFYCAAWSNLKSVRNAIKAGFKPGWVQMSAKSNEFIDTMLENKRIIYHMKQEKLNLEPFEMKNLPLIVDVVEPLWYPPVGDDIFKRFNVEYIVRNNICENDYRFQLVDVEEGKTQKEILSAAFFARKGDYSLVEDWFSREVQQFPPELRKASGMSKTYLSLMDEKTLALMNDDDIKLSLFVSRKPGAGLQILEQTCKRLKTEGWKNLYLWTDCDCNWQWYTKHGFTLVQEDIYEPFSNEQEDYKTYIFMRKL